MKPVSGENLKFTVPGLFDGKYSNLTLEPFYNIHDSRYMMYWLSMTDKEYANYKDKARRDEENRLALDRITVDAVNNKRTAAGGGSFHGEQIIYIR